MSVSPPIEARISGAMNNIVEMVLSGSINKEIVIVVAGRFGEVDVWDNIIIEPQGTK